MKEYGSRSMVGRLRRAVMRRPDEAQAAASPADWHYSDRIELEAARAVHDEFAERLRAWDVEVFYHDEPLPCHSDSMFVFDPALVIDHGAVLLSMGKEARRGEEEALGRCLKRLGIPIHARLQGRGHVEGGDIQWLDHDTLAVGRGFRTDDEGVKELRAVLAPAGISVMAFDLPYLTGAEACLHLLTLLSPIDVDLAVAYLPLLPVPLWQELKSRGVRLLEVPEDEFRLTQATNVLTVAPRRCIMLDQNPVTQRLLKENGCEVAVIPGGPLSFKTEGGPTCLTLPVLRDAI